MRLPSPVPFVLSVLLTSLPAGPVLGAADSAPPPDPHRLGEAVVPARQQITLRLDADRADYTGTVTVELEVPAPTDRFRFHAEDMELTDVTLIGAGGGYTVTATPGEVGLVEAVADRPLVPGSYTLTVSFRNNFDTTAHGLYRLEVEGAGYSFTQFEADDAREAFPCWDEPAFKLPYQMTLVVPEEHLAVSNTPIVAETVADGWRTVEFARTPPLPSYLLAIATGPLETVAIPGLSVPGNVVTVRGQEHLTQEAVRLTPPLLAELEEYFGARYPFRKLDLIAVPEFWPGAMENPGAVTFADRILLIDPTAVTVSQRRRLAEVIAHELAHMWYGDLVTMVWWDDLWLNESFASWMGTKVTHAVFPEFHLDVSQLRGTTAALRADAQLATRAIRKPVLASDNLIQSADVLAYQKGEAVLGMVERWIGEEAFRAGVLAYLERHAWGNARGEDLWAALSEVSGQDVAATLTSFLDQPGFPLIRAEATPEGIRLSQRRFLHHGVEAPEPQLWNVPVTLRYRDGEGVHEASVLLDRRERTLPDTPGEGIAWIHANVDERGYYRWTAGAESMRALAEQAGELLSARERVGFLGNLGSLLQAGELGGDDYLEMLGLFAEDPEPAVIAALLGGLSLVREAFVPEEAEDLFASYVRRTLKPALQRFGRERREGEDETVTEFRPRLIGWLVQWGRDPEIADYARDLGRRYLADPESVDPSLVSVGLNALARDGDEALFEDLVQRFETTRVPAERGRYLGALGRFQEPELRERALEYVLEGPLRPNELFQIPFGMSGEGEAADDRLWEWMTTHYDRIAERIPPLFLVFLPRFGGGCDEAKAERVQAFFGEGSHSPPGTDKELAKVLEGIANCSGLREREGAAVLDYLREVAETP